ncbi:MAG: alpha-amylase family glycosyl hydrolase [Candidatus Lernaella stagnicola]|nr:alpha-amylase family glycosyl hydrolase [Candidatus Lernaella stagnicola]
MRATLDVETSLRAYFPFGFHLSRQAWAQYDVAELLDEDGEWTVVDDILRLRKLALRINQERLRSTYNLPAVHAGQLTTIALIQDILRFVAHLYCHDQLPGVLARGLTEALTRRGAILAEKPPTAFVSLFPPQNVARGRLPEDEYLPGEAPAAVEIDVPAREIVAVEMILLWLAANNPAFQQFRELFDDEELKKAAPYIPFVEEMERWFKRQQPVDRIDATFFEALRAPMRAAPDSLEGQLDFMKETWGNLLPSFLRQRIAVAINILREEEMRRGFGPPERRVLEFGADAYGARDDTYEPAAFSEDADWMSNVVLLAKSTYVWLDQLTKWYGRDIHTLADIPDEELDRLARWGFTGLWLIGLWERSPASRQIKNWTGNPEAVASAYSLYDYVIAEDLGGEAAYENLRERAARRGIRLASDMVPNHVGLYSKWIVEHPDWFVQSAFPPFPAYAFTGGDLSGNPGLGLFLEDGYWSRSDAAVVFKRVDHETGDARYIYHGNDGTNMPWNDTAQLNFLLPEVREAVIQTVLHVARKFSIIRFDAAMTLAKKHFQRLWFPTPGEGGAIPSRAEHGMTREQFDTVFPKEFWREVVDRVKAEAPDTLLLAEAFWLMEGYFVRTLGMHRVYNSAFMNMLKMEDNAKYRQTVKNVLEFSPEVIKRFVNFMNNPDEDTAIAQFGDGDKYFGVAVLMVTMPGLPMFGHGQVEGFTEKYGMEYRRAYWDETPSEHLVGRHEREIFPLMRRRKLFSGAANFALFDFVTDAGWVDENVFAHTNRADNERAIILFNNAYEATSGRITMSTAVNIGSSEQPNIVRRSLAEALALNTDEDVYYAYTEHRTGLQFLRHGRALAAEGLRAELGGYQYQALIDFHEIRDTDGSWAALAGRLGERGVPNLTEARREMELDPVLGPCRALFHGDTVRALLARAPQADAQFRQHLQGFFAAVASFARSDAPPEPPAAQVAEETAVVIDPAATLQKAGIDKAAAGKLVAKLTSAEKPLQPVLIAWLIARRTGRFRGPRETTPAPLLSANRLDEWLLGKVFTDTLMGYRQDEQQGRIDGLLVRFLLAHGDFLEAQSEPPAAAIERALADARVRDLLAINEHEGHEYIGKEPLERLVDAVLLAYVIDRAARDELTAEGLAKATDAADKILAAAETGGYQVAKTLELL